MSDWVEYLTRADDSPIAALRRANGRDAPWRVPFWGLGNEAWGCGCGAVCIVGPAVRHMLPRPCGNALYRIAVGANESDLRWTERLMRSSHPYTSMRSTGMQSGS